LNQLGGYLWEGDFSYHFQIDLMLCFRSVFSSLDWKLQITSPEVRT
jgi:hypothetical protein